MPRIDLSADYSVVRGFLWAGRQLQPGERFDVTGLHRTKVHTLLSARKIRLAPNNSSLEDPARAPVQVRSTARRAKKG